MKRGNGTFNLLLLILLILSTINLVNGRYSRRKSRRGKRKTPSTGYKRQPDPYEHSTRSCSSASSKCDCHNRPYEVITGIDRYGCGDSYSPIERLDGYGQKVTCFHYTIARIKPKDTLCTDKSLNSIIIGLDPLKAKCKKTGCSGYRDLIASMKCDCGCSRCCTTSIDGDSRLNTWGVKFTMGYSIDTSPQEVEVEICLKGWNHEMMPRGGLIAYTSKDTTGFSCDNYNIPNFCDGM